MQIYFQLKTKQNKNYRNFNLEKKESIIFLRYCA